MMIVRITIIITIRIIIIITIKTIIITIAGTVSTAGLLYSIRYQLK